MLVRLLILIRIFARIFIDKTVNVIYSINEINFSSSSLSHL